jgi:putative flavoprotein involved in K+ transport
MDTTTSTGARDIETVVIGAGQAGLSAGYHLRKKAREFVILDSYERVGDNWRCHWDSLLLFPSAKYDGLPGLPFRGRPVVVPRQERRCGLLGDLCGRRRAPVPTRSSSTIFLRG